MVLSDHPFLMRSLGVFVFAALAYSVSAAGIEPPSHAFTASWAQRAFLGALVPGVSPSHRALVLQGARSQLGKFPQGSMERTSAAYVLAMLSPDPRLYVSSLVESPKLFAHQKRYDDKVLVAVPDALVAIETHRHSDVALRALMTLELDGGPGEITKIAQIGLFLAEPIRVVKVANGRPLRMGAGAWSFANTLRNEVREDAKVRSRVRSIYAQAERYRDRDHLRLREFLSKILKPVSSKRPDQRHKPEARKGTGA